MKPTRYVYLLLSFICWGQMAEVYSQANTALSNLAPTAVNQDLLPNAVNTRSLGSLTKSWRKIYLDSSVFLSGKRFLSFGTNITTGVTAVGNSALLRNTGASNTAVGYYAMAVSTTGINNTGTGFKSLSGNTTGANNTASGFASLFMSTTGGSNAAFGSSAMEKNVSGSNNTALGAYSLFGNTTGKSNVAVGVRALLKNTTGNNSVAVGDSALLNNNNNLHNTAVGSKASYANTTGGYNVAVGYQAAYSSSTGSSNTALGYLAMTSNVSGSNNTAVGYSAAQLNTGGSNVSVGAFAGYYASNNSTFLGWDTYGSSAGITNSTAVGYHAPTTASNQVRLGDGNVTSIGGSVGWSVISDGRFKKNVKEDVPGLDFINELRPVTYNFDPAAFNKALSASNKRPSDAMGQSLASEDKAAGEEKAKMLYSGFIAQEVEAVAKKMKYEFSGVDAPKNDNDYYGLRYSDFVVPLVKAVQELSATVKEKEEKITQLEARLEKIESFMKDPLAAGGEFSGAKLGQNAPNPIKGTTTISYYIPQTFRSAQLAVYDVNGQTLKLVSIPDKGKGTVNLNATALTSGTYSYSLFINGKVVDTKKMIIAH